MIGNRRYGVHQNNDDRVLKGKRMIKIMTLNINSYSTRQGPWPVRIGLIREVVEDACPDIIALQSVRKEPGQFQGEDQAEQLASLFNRYPNVYFQSAMVFPDGAEEGSAILSRLPIIERDYRHLTLLPGQEDNIQRVFLHAQIRLASGWLHLFNANFSWTPKQAAKNVREALDDMEGISGPALLVGDMNTVPFDPALEPLRKKGWKDIWADLYPEDDGFTFFEAGGLVKRIDYAWGNPDLMPRVRGIKIVAGEVEGISARPSDHAGLLISLDLIPTQDSSCA
jgi:endonuclease/exonuclease/phosphatase family metal-dependent hydrolase